MKKFVTLLLLAAVCFLALPTATYAQLPYRTSYYDANQSSWLRIQPIYEPAETTGARFTEPVDLQVGADNNVYVADKGAGKVFVMDNDGSLIQTIGDEEGPGALSAPEGLYVIPEGQVYVADSGNQRIAVFGKDGKFIREYKKPVSTFLETEHFVPTKLVVDRRGVMYINLNSSYQGLLRINKEGEFLGYFGANKAQQTVLNWLKKLILNKEQLAKELAALPRPISNVSLDNDGFIYTSTAGGFGQGAIRKLNAGGVDALKNKTIQNGHGIVDTAIDERGFLYDIDMFEGRVTIYDDNAEALFAFGLVDNGTQQYGVLGYPTAIGVDADHNIWISDSRVGTVHKYKLTEFGSDVMNALALYKEGRYKDSEPYWDRVYARNDMYNGTFQGLGKVYLHDNEQHEALSYLKAAFDTKSYSKAFWQVRLTWLQNHFLLAAAIIAVLIALIAYGPRLIRSYFRRFPLPASWEKPVEDLRNFWYVMFHPYQGFYRLKEARVPSWIIILILVGAIAVKIISMYYTGFLFNPVELSQINLFSSLGLFVVPWVTWIIANYLVCSIKDGEGKFREVIQGSAYALAPYIFFSIPTILLSNIVTLDERVIVDSLNAIMFIWMGVMLIVMTQVIHNFDFMESIKNIAITVFTIGTIWLFAFIVFGLTFNLYDFFYQLYKEVTFIG
ncbi:YIP1 family protein [Paenibacillus gorillae]|uniref:YIP1 family protein n=1 Tax=Paenibacillus gorillae TaxID=1243662 RepID=UPI0004BA7C0E|nr:YIP1 family protein [Paenibacillus gorillae]